MLLELEKLLRVSHQQAFDGNLDLVRNDLCNGFSVDDGATSTASARTSQIEKTDRFVWKRLLRHVAHREFDSRLNGRRLVRDAVMNLVARRDSTKNLDRVVGGWLGDVNR